MKPVIIFDFGNVLAHFDPTRACRVWSKKFGIRAETLWERVRGPGFRELTEEHETGRMPPQEFAKRFCQRAGVADMPYEEFQQAWRGIFRLNQPVVDLALSLREKGYRLLLGSNTNPIHADAFREKYAQQLSAFESLVLSYEVGVMKPHQDFYKACADAAGVPSPDCLFIDDLKENVQAARDTGMIGLWFRDEETLRAELHQAGIELPSNTDDLRTTPA